MRKTEIAAGLVIVALVFATAGIIVFQQSEINDLRQEIGEVIPFNSRDWGATIYMAWYRSGVLLSEEAHHNVITNAGRTALRGHIGDTPVAVWDYIAIGTSTGGGVGSTTLQTEYDRDQGTYATVGSYNFTITFEWGPGNFSGQTITELGVFNAAAAGTMLNYDDSFSRGPLQSTDSLEVIVNFQVGS